MSNVSHHLGSLSSLQMFTASSPFISFLFSVDGQYFIMVYLGVKNVLSYLKVFDIRFQKKKKLKPVT